jgi:hypothetical protein
MPNLLVRHTIPLEEQPPGGPLLFYQWIPDGLKDALHLVEGPFNLSVWLNRDCVYSFHGLIELTDEEIHKWVAIPAVRFFIDVTPPPVSEELAAFIVESASRPGNAALTSDDFIVRTRALEYQKLGWCVLRPVLKVANRIIDWAYAEHRHFWLSTFDEDAPIMMSRNIQFDTKVSIEGGPWLRWFPPNNDTHNIGTIGGQKGLTSEGWTTLGRYLQTDRRSSLTGELLGNASVILAHGHGRAALIEAVSALEFAVRRFARSPRRESLRIELPGNITGNDVKTAIEHLGFTAAVRFLLPLIIREEEFPIEAHHIASIAIELRHNIIHNGQRNVDPNEVEKFIRAIRVLAEALDRVTDGDA